jgi:UDP-N-acetylglucosamine:LPS N-acetylglucosamine transferase
MVNFQSLTSATSPSGEAQAQLTAAGAPEILLVCSSGGHLLQLYALRDAWREHSVAWVTFDTSDARSLLERERIFIAHSPTARNVGNLLRNLLLAWRVTGALRPRAIVTTGAGIAVPFAWVGRLRGARVVYIESLSRITKPSLSCRLIRPVASRIYVQWPELIARLPEARYLGVVISPR